MQTHSSIRNIVALVILLAWAGGANALPPDDPQAHFNRAVELAKTGKYEEAVGLCLGVLDSLPESEQARVHKLLGYVYRKLDKNAEAWHHLGLYLQSTDKDDAATAGWLREVEDKLKENRVKVTLTCAVEGVSLRVESSGSKTQSTYPCPLIWWFQPGNHVLLASKEGQPEYKAEITVRELGDKGIHAIDFPVKKKAPTETTRPVQEVNPPVVIAEPRETPTHSRTLEWALSGGGSALVAAGAVFHGLAYSREEDLYSKYRSDRPAYDKAYDDEVAPKMTAAYVLYGVGGAALVGSVVTWVLNKPKKDGADGSTVSFTPYALPGGSGAQMTLRW